MADQKKYEVRVPKTYNEVHKVSATSAEEAREMVLSGESVDGWIELASLKPDTLPSTSGWIVTEV